VRRPAEGLAAVQEAVGHYRTLAEANPDAYLPNLAGTLNNLSSRLGEVRRPAEGLAAIEEAVGHYRTLAKANPSLFGPALHQSLDVTAWLEGIGP
ncbi:ATP-binding protein, partial [Kitasatospora sp. NPDC058063]